MSSTPRLSVILPTYNEAGNIVDLIRQIRLQLPAEWTHEFWVIDDNSPDGTYQTVLNAFPGDPGVHAVLKTHERGLAAAIGTGIQKATGEYLLIMDTDFTHRPEELPRMLHIAQVCDLVSGSRFCSGGRMTSTTHYLASFLYNVILRIILRTQVQDNLGGYWIARRENVLALDCEIIFKGYGDYFFKLLKLLRSRNAFIVEIPAFYAARHTGHSKSNFFRLLGKYTLSALAFKSKLKSLT
jgi:dolichol-phosphate mannosyltransferase